MTKKNWKKKVNFPISELIFKKKKSKIYISDDIIEDILTKEKTPIGSWFVNGIKEEDIDIPPLKKKSINEEA